MRNLILPRAVGRTFVRDGMMTFDARTIDSAGAFLIGELERLDPTLNAPLAAVSWSRDIDLREDVSIADEYSSFTNSNFAAVGGTSTTGKAWIGKDASAIASMQLDIGKTALPLTLWGMQLGWTIPELESAQKLGRPVDQQKFQGMQLKFNMDVDEMVYVGDSTLGVTGLINNAAVSKANAAAAWNASTAPDVILSDINALLTRAWTNSGYAVCPSKILMPPVEFGLLQRPVTTAGSMSILEYVKQNSIALSINGKPLDIQPLKWGDKNNSGLANNRVVAYTQDQGRVRYPLVPLQRTPLEYRDIRQLTTYFGRLGVVEFVYPETVAYMDLI